MGTWRCMRTASAPSDRFFIAVTVAVSGMMLVRVMEWVTVAVLVIWKRSVVVTVAVMVTVDVL